MFEQGRGAMHVQPPFPLLAIGQVLQDLGLERRAETLRFPDAVVLGGGFEFAERGRIFGLPWGLPKSPVAGSPLRLDATAPLAAGAVKE